MTSSANDCWDYGKLMEGLRYLEFTTKIKDDEETPFEFGKFQKESYQHLIAFVEYNMREMEITGGNGD